MKTVPFSTSSKDLVFPVYSRSISWKAILAGAVASLGLTVLFHLFTLGAGLMTYRQTLLGIDTIASGVFLWLLVGGFAILFISGLMVGSLSHSSPANTANGLIHGFLSWCVYLLISLYFITHLSGYTPILLPKNFLHQQTQMSNERANPKEYSPNNNLTAHTAQPIGTASFATFFVFLCGALGSSLGGHYGAKWCRKCMDESERSKPMAML